MTTRNAIRCGFCALVILVAGPFCQGKASAQPIDPLQALNLSLHTGNPIAVAEVGREDAFYLEAALPDGAVEVRFRLHLAMSDFDGRESEWTSASLVAAPGRPAKVSLASVIPAVGWWRVRPKVLALDGDVAVAKAPRELAYIDPAGPCDLPPEDGFWFGLDSRDRSPEILRLFSQMGVNILRFGTWSGVNPGENEWAWEPFDEVVDAMRKHRMQALYSVTFTPPYALKPEHQGKKEPSRLPPRSDALGAALETIVAHSRDKGITIYDLWNEPDHRGFWHGNTDEYLEFMRVAYETIKRIDPDATVLSGGIASLHETRSDGRNPGMDRRIVLDGSQSYDAIALHEHGTFDRFADALDGPLTELRAELDSEKGLWFTETGHNGDGHDKAVVLVQKFTYARLHNAEGFVWFAFYPPNRGGAYNMIDENGDPQPVVPAYNQMVRMMRGKRFTHAFEDNALAGNRLFAFADATQTLYIAWGAGATAFQAPIRLAEGADAQAFDIMGRELTLERSEGAVYLPFARVPRYLLVNGNAEVGGYEPIAPLALFPFGDLEPARGLEQVNVSPLEPVGWNRFKPGDEDARLARLTGRTPNGMFDGDQEAMHLRFTITPVDGATLDIDRLGFWGGAGAFGDTTMALTYELAGAEPVAGGALALRNMSIPGFSGEYYEFPLSGLSGVAQPVTFTLTVGKNGQRAILKIDDLRLDGVVRK